MTEDTDLKHSYQSPEEEAEAVRVWHEYDERIHAAELAVCKALMLAPMKDVAGRYVGPLLSENILSVSPQTVKIMGLVIPRNKLALFLLALHWIIAGVEGAQGSNGYTYSKVQVARGMDVLSGFKIESNVTGEGSILLTRQIACELYEIVLYLCSLDGKFETVDSDFTDIEEN